jgi:hypothetical protein
LDGREPEQVTVYEYDSGGRVVRSVTTCEPRWTEQDRAEMLALGVWRDGLCPLCRRPLSVCTSHEQDGPQFEASFTACRSTLAILEKQRGVYQKPSENRPAHLWSATIRKR